MGKSRRSVGERHGTLKLRVFVQKLRNSFFLCRSLNGEETKDEVFRAYEVPEDVKEGCFAVSAIDGGTPKRFVVGLAYLNHPEFVKLLAKAEEEFGFEQPGALAVPCLASDLQSILADS
eukprot:TRINITY_DN8086_c1_g2_i1.p1 TRINITY_DN8086_c1_g2~~TRINITY_DN8086_c1_g2_i1.p1  ORF type:complete len:119 (+),score=32.30 TRINITY_DN8086_c1_g2_i1:312-668(+)